MKISRKRLEEIEHDNEIARQMAERLLGTDDFVAPVLVDHTDTKMRRVLRSGVRTPMGSVPCPICGKSSDRFWAYDTLSYGSEAAEPSYCRNREIELVCPKHSVNKIEMKGGWQRGRPEFEA